MDSSDKINVLIIGSNGRLGSFIVKHCLTKSNLITNILIRDRQKNQELVSQVEGAGGKVFEGDIMKPETIKNITKGMHTVIMAVAFGIDITLQGQMNVIDDCEANGVKRIVPTEYSENFLDFTEEELKDMPVIKSKLQVENRIKSLPIKLLQINSGIFLECMFDFLFAKGFDYWGDANHRFQVTTYEDTGRFIAAAVADKEKEGRLSFVANEVSAIEAAEIYNRVRGANKEAKYKGSLEDLRNEAEDLKKKGDPNAWIPDWFALVFDDRSKFKKIDNQEYPDVKVTTVEELLKQRTDLVVL